MQQQMTIEAERLGSDSGVPSATKTNCRSPSPYSHISPANKIINCTS
jgi:hypothetical protein